MRDVRICGGRDQTQEREKESKDEDGKVERERERKRGVQNARWKHQILGEEWNSNKVGARGIEREYRREGKYERQCRAVCEK